MGLGEGIFREIVKLRGRFWLGFVFCLFLGVGFLVGFDLEVVDGVLFGVFFGFGFLGLGLAGNCKTGDGFCVRMSLGRGEFCVLWFGRGVGAGASWGLGGCGAVGYEGVTWFVLGGGCPEIIKLGWVLCRDVRVAVGSFVFCC